MSYHWCLTQYLICLTWEVLLYTAFVNGKTVLEKLFNSHIALGRGKYLMYYWPLNMFESIHDMTYMTDLCSIHVPGPIAHTTLLLLNTWLMLARDKWIGWQFAMIVISVFNGIVFCFCFRQSQTGMTREISDIMVGFVTDLLEWYKSHSNVSCLPQVLI